MALDCLSDHKYSKHFHDVLIHLHFSKQVVLVLYLSPHFLYSPGILLAWLILNSFNRPVNCHCFGKCFLDSLLLCPSQCLFLSPSHAVVVHCSISLCYLTEKLWSLKAQHIFIILSFCQSPSSVSCRLYFFIMKTFKTF